MAYYIEKVRADQIDTMNGLLASIASHVGTEGIEVTNWEDVQRIVRMGLADKVFAVGDQFVSSYDTGQIVWDVIGINHDVPSDKKYKNSLTLQAHDCVLNAMFDAPEALYFAETGLTAGTYHFTNGATKYQFTLTQPVPAGGHITFPWAYDTDILTTQIKTYASKTSTTVIESVPISVGSSGIELTDINDINRTRYGSNNYIESAVKQWLNSNAATFVWTAKTNFDRPPTGAPYTGAGFLKLLDPELVGVLGAVDKQVAKNTVTDGGGQDLFNDKVFLLSRKEVFGGDEGVVTGEKPYPWYSTLTGSPTTDPLAGRIKYLSSSARLWWLRSPHVGYSYFPRIVHTSGVVRNYIAYYALGLAPACCIV